MGQPSMSDQNHDAPSRTSESSIDALCINAIHTLSMDAVQKANSGHPGTAMALAPLVYTLWQTFLRFDPEDQIWPNRDRFVLSIGHASMPLYSILHLTGVKAVDAKYERLGRLSVTLDDIKQFRQLGSKCTGHPEYHLTSGVETTTGPLGQGCATSVGMAIAAKWMGQHFNNPGSVMFDYDTYVLCGDGDMMEGVASEAASLAGHLMLGNLCWIYDNNRVTIDGHTDITFSEDVGARFMAYGWNVERVGDANDCERVAKAIEKFRRTECVPTLIIVDSHIGYGSPHKHDTSVAHGEPLGDEEVRLTKRGYGWPEDARFLVPDGVRARLQDGVGQRGRQQREAWIASLSAYRHAMAAVMNGLALSKVRAFGSTYLIFSDYLKPALRLSAVMEVPTIFVFTHDSIGVGEDGPTHQPVEQLIALRAIPGLITIRPSDAHEVTEAWRVILGLKHQPACLVLSRQPLPAMDRTRYAPAAGDSRGAYVLADARDRKPEVLLIGTGSEVSLCIEVFETLSNEGIAARVVSMPSWELFELQTQAYRDEVLPPNIFARVSVEEGSVIGWDRYTGSNGARIGMPTFGSSAPLKDLKTKFGFTPERIISAAREQLVKVGRMPR